MRLILASGSPRRKELLEQIGIKFEVITSNADENTNETEPGSMVMELSKKKTDAVYQDLRKSVECSCGDEDIKNEEFAVIGADTLVFHKDRPYGKPADEQMAYDMVKSLAGNVHQVYTGVTIMCSDGTVKSFYEKTDVEVFPMTDKEIMNYVKSGEPMDKAGAYGIQGAFAAFVKGIRGDYNNIVGLPVARLYQELKKMNCKIEGTV